MGVDFYADRAYANSGFPVYRLYSSSNGNHRWTGNYDDIDNLKKSGYVVESVAFNSISPVRQEQAPLPGKELTYRFFIPQTNGHFWTNNVYERDGLIQSGYQYEGVAWQSVAGYSGQPVYRLYSPLTRQHLYTTSAAERDNLNNTGGVWRYEGVAFYATNAPTTQPAYRLYSPVLRVHHITMNIHERDDLARTGKWNYEGVAWYL